MLKEKKDIFKKTIKEIFWLIFILSPVIIPGIILIRFKKMDLQNIGLENTIFVLVVFGTFLLLQQIFYEILFYIRKVENEYNFPERPL